METLVIEPRDYDAIRGNPRQFIVLPGHVFPEAERVVTEADGHVVVEKIGAAGAAAEAFDSKD